MSRNSLIVLIILCTAHFLFHSPISLCSEIIQTAVVVCSSASWDSGTHSIISVDPVGGPRYCKNNLLPTSCSDLTVVTYGSCFYRIERFNADNITKFSINDPDTPIWQYSTKDENDTVSSTNPHTIIFASDEKAYLLRNNTPIAWIINPSANSEAEFKTGELDLHSYNDDGISPEMTNGVIVGGKFFILLQRLDQDNSWIPDTPYLAVYDLATDTEIDTKIPNNDGVSGIPLPIKNPGAIQYLEINNTIYVQGAGRFEFSGPADYSGGIVTVNPSTYESALLLDDGNDTDHPYGNISGMAILSPIKGYFVGYAGWGDMHFIPSTHQLEKSRE